MVDSIQGKTKIRRRSSPIYRLLSTVCCSSIQNPKFFLVSQHLMIGSISLDLGQDAVEQFVAGAPEEAGAANLALLQLLARRHKMQQRLLVPGQQRRPIERSAGDLPLQA